MPIFAGAIAFAFKIVIHMNSATRYFSIKSIKISDTPIKATKLMIKSIIFFLLFFDKLLKMYGKR